MTKNEILKLVEEPTEELLVSSELGPSSQSGELAALKIELMQKDSLDMTEDDRLYICDQIVEKIIPHLSKKAKDI